MSPDISVSDATLVLSQYEALIDKNTHHPRRPVVYEQQTFYGELQRIFAIELDAIPSVNQEPQTLILGVIRTCIMTGKHATLDIHYYSKDGPLEVVDITAVACVVGRIKDIGSTAGTTRWAIIDRSGALLRAIYVEDD